MRALATVAAARRGRRRGLSRVPSPPPPPATGSPIPTVPQREERGPQLPAARAISASAAGLPSELLLRRRLPGRALPPLPAVRVRAPPPLQPAAGRPHTRA